MEKFFISLSKNNELKIERQSLRTNIEKYQNRTVRCCNKDLKDNNFLI